MSKPRADAPFMRDGRLVWPCPGGCGAEFPNPPARGKHLLFEDCPGRTLGPATIRGAKKPTPPWRKFEKLLARCAKAIADQGVSLEHRSPHQVSGTQIRHKAPLDFEGDWHGRAVKFDAKSCGEAAFPIKSIAPHQMTRLAAAWGRGALAFVLIEMRPAQPAEGEKAAPPRYFAVPWPVLARYQGPAAARKSITLEALAAEAVEVRRVALRDRIAGFKGPDLMQALDEVFAEFWTGGKRA